MADFQTILKLFLRGLNKEDFYNSQVAIHNFGTCMEKHPRFKGCLDSFVNSLPESFEYNINEIIVHSYMSAFGVSFTVDNPMAIVVGVLLFVEI